MDVIMTPGRVEINAVERQASTGGLSPLASWHRIWAEAPFDERL